MSDAQITRRRRRVVGLVGLGLLVAVGVTAYLAYQHYTDPQRIRRLAEEFLERLTQRRVRIASASFSAGEGVHLRDVYVSNQPVSDDAKVSSPISEEEVFACREIFLLPNSWALLGGRLEIESLAAVQPTLTLVHDADVGWANVDSLLRGIFTRRQGSQGAAPPIELRHARVRIVHRTASGDRDIEDFQLTIRGRRDVADPNLFDVVWQDANDPEANGHAQIDLTSGHARNVRGGLPTMSIRGVILAMDAGMEGVDAWPESLGIEGRVRIRDYDFMDTTSSNPSRWATVELIGAKVSIPVSEDERTMKAAQRYLRFEEVSGTAKITAAKIDAQVDAVFHGSPCKVTAVIEGPLGAGMTLADVSLSGDVSVRRLTFPDPKRSAEEDRFVRRWPAIARFYDEYDPHGKVDVDFRVEKAAGANERFLARKVVVAAQGADASCDIFPYRVENLRGTVEYGSGGLFVRNLCGVRNDAAICLDGWIEKPKKSAAAQLSITGKDVPIDEALLTALHPNERSAVEQFSPAGRFDALVGLRRDASSNDLVASPWNTVIHVSFDDLRAAYERVPVPITHLAGSATIFLDRVEIEGAEGDVGTGSVALHGLAKFKGGGLHNLHLDVAASDVDLDASVSEDLPPGVTSRIEAFGLTGCVSAQSELTFDEAAGWGHETWVNIRGMGLKPKAFPLPIQHGLADLRIDSQKVEITRARGVYGDAQLFAKGSFALGGVRDADVHIEADKLAIDSGFKDAAPPSLREAIADWAVDEPIQAEIRFRQGENVPAWSGRVVLHDATLRHRAFSEPLRNTDATVSFADNEIECEKAEGRLGRATMEAEFHARHDAESSSAAIRLSVNNLALDDSARGLLPAKARGVWDDLSPSGRANLVLDDLVYFRGQSASATWSVRGHLDPLDVRCSRGELAIGRGAIPFEGMLVDRLGGLTLSGDLRDGDVTIYGQRMMDAAASWYVARTAAGEGRAGVRDFRGDVDGGTATTQAQLSFDSTKAQYRVASSIQGADLAAWLESWRARAAPADNQSAAAKTNKPTDVRGLIDAQFHLSGRINDPASRTGGGRVEIHDGYIYKLPIFLAILQVLDITIPNNDVLSEARGQFYIMGNSVRLADIVVSGESLSLVGQGTLSLSDQSVDLTLVNAGAGRLSGIPVLAELWEGASRELVELRVTGPVSQPQVRASPFRGVTDEFKKLFQKRKPKRM